MSASRATGLTCSRASRHESKSQDMKKRSNSCPRGPLFPIATTLTHVKRTEYNREKVSPGAAASASSPTLSSINVTTRSKTPTGTNHTPTFVNRPFTAKKSPAVTAKTPTTPGIKEPWRTTTSRVTSASPIFGPISSITGKPIPPTETKVSKGAAKEDHKVTKAVSRVEPTGSKEVEADKMARKGRIESVVDGAARSGSKSKTIKCSADPKGSNYNMSLKVQVTFNGDGSGAEVTAVNGNAKKTSSSKKGEGDRSPRKRISIRSDLDESTGGVKDKDTKITVAVRLRPYSKIELNDPKVSRVVHVDKKKHLVTVNKTAFEFDHVLDSFEHFTPIDDQAAVYRTVGQPLLEHALNGYNVCLFAYGQTGSGKTYSLTGPEEDVHEYATSGDTGIIPRFVRDLFLDLTPGSLVTLTYIEIYNDQIISLLHDSNSSITYKVREHPILGPYIPNLVPIVVETSDDLLSHLSVGNIRRKKAATSCNEHSSRSHAIVTLVVHQKSDDPSILLDTSSTETDSNTSEDERIMSKINLVDLAGSERVAAVQSTGDRFKEGTYINRSLLTLGKVISELSDLNGQRRGHKSHIPYRDSTLTFLLKESLGGNSKTCMLATISPSCTQLEETLSTLRYASKASKIVNRIRINEDPKNKKIRLLEIEIERLKALLSLPSSITSRATTPALTTAESSCNETEPKKVNESKKDRNNNNTPKIKGSKNDPINVPSSTEVSPNSTAASSAESTPKKSNLKKNNTPAKKPVENGTTPSTSCSTTPTKSSTPIHIKKGGKDQGTLTERLRQIDLTESATNTECEEIPILNDGGFKSKLIEHIEEIFSEDGLLDEIPKKSKSPKDGNGKKNQKGNAASTSPKEVISKKSSDEKKSEIEEQKKDKKEKAEQKTPKKVDESPAEKKGKNSPSGSENEKNSPSGSEKKDKMNSEKKNKNSEKTNKKDPTPEKKEESKSPEKKGSISEKKETSPPEKKGKNSASGSETPPNEKKSKGKGKKASVDSNLSDESTLTQVLNQGMIQNSTIEISESEESKHVNFKDTHEVREYDVTPSVIDSTQQSFATANESVASSSSSGTSSPKGGKKDKKVGKGKKTDSSPDTSLDSSLNKTPDLMAELSQVLKKKNEEKKKDEGKKNEKKKDEGKKDEKKNEKKNKSPPKNKNSTKEKEVTDWDADDNDLTDDLNKEEPVIVDLTAREAEDEGWGDSEKTSDAKAAGDDWDSNDWNTNDDNKNDDNNNNDDGDWNGDNENDENENDENDNDQEEDESVIEVKKEPAGDADWESGW